MSSSRTSLADVEAWRRAGHVITLDGHRIFYRREGRGRPLLCVHGYPTASFDFVKLWPALTPRFDVIAPDMLGFGFSDKPRGHRYSVFAQTTLQVRLLEALGLLGEGASIDVLCHDYGVTIGQELLARHAAGTGPTLRSITFLNGGLFPETHRARVVQKLLATPLGPLLASLSGRRSFDRTMRGIFGPDTQPTDDELEALYALVGGHEGRRALAGLIHYMGERRAHRTRLVTPIIRSTVPMRFINGVHDPISGAHMLDRLLALRPDADVVRLPVGHYPQLEAPEAVLEAFLPFVAAPR